MIDTIDLSHYLISLTDLEAGDGISNLKLQKLLYYCQGLHLALHDAPLFNDPIEAWEHGPVVPKIYHEYKEYECNHIPIPKGISLEEVSSNEEVKKIVDEVYNVYGQFSAWKLRNMTHEEPPWSETRRCEVITHEKIKRYFSTLVKEDIAS